MSTVDCITLDGSKKTVQKANLIWRPSAFGIIVNEGKVLLMRMRQTGKYHLPGGGIKIGEAIEDTLKREIREEAGIEIGVERFAHVEELFFYYDPSCKAYHGLHLYYICQPQTVDLLHDNQVNDGSAEKPRWVEIDALAAKDFQSCGDKILELLVPYQ